MDLAIGRSYRLKAEGVEVRYLGTILGLPAFRRLNNGMDIRIDPELLNEQLTPMDIDTQPIPDQLVATPDEQAEKLDAQEETVQTEVQAPSVVKKQPRVSKNVVSE
ncbi:hypothetical protein [Floridanema aerugineum]|uniref:Uncharacterized protein n=1 Tax=Floridaenema aerugineum BLCC-F46 TaxID=3153654 RepID=A0ABV4X2B5_9CYAN